MKAWFINRFSAWLNQEIGFRQSDALLTDLDRLSEEILPADVILVEGRSRLSEVIKTVSSSPWTHAALYIGRLDEIRDGALQSQVAGHFRGAAHEQLIIEALLGQGTVVCPLHKYQGLHLRICRPKGLSRPDRQQVIAYAIGQLGYAYDVRHMLDLFRFLLPYSFIPKRWRSSLFERHAGQQTRNVCSYMIAEAFSAVSYPILPVAERLEDGSVKLYRRNTRLFSPRDFDYSPYFDVIKFPYFSFDDVAAYRSLPWDAQDEIRDVTGQFRKRD